MAGLIDKMNSLPKGNTVDVKEIIDGKSDAQVTETTAEEPAQGDPKPANALEPAKPAPVDDPEPPATEEPERGQ